LGAGNQRIFLEYVERIAGSGERGQDQADRYCGGGGKRRSGVAIDGPSGGYDDDPEQGGDSQPAKGLEHGAPRPCSRPTAGGECMANVKI
jgi:hypothetical protein